MVDCVKALLLSSERITGYVCPSSCLPDFLRSSLHTLYSNFFFMEQSLSTWLHIIFTVQVARPFNVTYFLKGCGESGNTKVASGDEFWDS